MADPTSSPRISPELAELIRRYDPEESVGYLIKQAHLSFQRAVDAEMTALDLTAMQWGPLMLLAMGRGETAAELARNACSDTGAMTRMLDRLESKGLIRRVRSAEDRRVLKLELTEEGVRAAEQVPQRLHDAVDLHTRDFSEQEVQQLKSLLRRMAANGAQRG
ncbi:MarR family transcriptional regulator [Pigmentiphaga sp.]|uniref:MarR family winged helix-turn-helix transcriptional regulator n=1 Tax=Pigmentiphaga sp. TaxID=1977564 RepID=UPI00128BF2BD|nr:MarR family transcriptional regulator [Pigmentiphaga sp.]MPS25926.1 MarR family transcriptional regulator [Alcaligenaceae bacterium SAGV5]MPS52906.1 MarR family transcriptional regulator [Alcaligenaceae bacterium SAGV3]MPT60279.1 MarR family transcriptional regulator [Alcaligenaceae bacterium]